MFSFCNALFALETRHYTLGESKPFHHCSTHHCVPCQSRINQTPGNSVKTLFTQYSIQQLIAIIPITKTTCSLYSKSFLQLGTSFFRSMEFQTIRQSFRSTYILTWFHLLNIWEWFNSLINFVSEFRLSSGTCSHSHEHFVSIDGLKA